MILSEVVFQSIIVDIILRSSTFISSVAYMTPFVLISTMRVQFIVPVKPFFAETTFRMSLEAALIYGARMIIPKPFMLSQFPECEQLMLMSEDLFASSAKVTGFLVRTIPA